MSQSNHNFSLHRSRASSTLSLAQSSCASSSSVTGHDVRTLTIRYQNMLEQATKEIKKLSNQKRNLEREQDKLLTVNIELATEAKRLVQDVKKYNIEKKELLIANDEFVCEVKKLYIEEEKWEEEANKLKADNANLSDSYANEINSVEADWKEELKIFKSKQNSLLESIRVLTVDNERLISEKDKAKVNSSQSTKDLKETQENNRIKLETTIDCLKSEIETEQILKEEDDKHMEELAAELEQVESEMDILRDEHLTKVNQIQSKYSTKVKGMVEKSEKMAAENFEYAVENEQLEKKLKVGSEQTKILDRNLSQLKVENQWLVNNNKKGNGNEEKAEDMARELQELKVELRKEKEKVMNLVDWKSQLAEKNKSLKDENDRLLKKTEHLEYMMNDEVSDINEVLKTINNLQDGGQIADRKRYTKGDIS